MYCVKCRKVTATRDVRTVVTKNKRRMIKGKCENCDSTKTRFVRLQKGGDVVSSLTATTSRVKLPWSRFPGEMHLPGHNFTGPGTNLHKRLNSDNTPKPWSKPINRVDRAAYRHDLAYAKHADSANRIVADRRMIKELDSIIKPTLRERMERAVVKPILKTKADFGF